MLFRFNINLADSDKGVYETLELRVDRHQSETDEYMLARVLAYSLEYQPYLKMGPGLSLGEEPSVTLMSDDGRSLLWVDIGLPTPERLQRAIRISDRVIIYAHRGTTTVDALSEQFAGKNVDFVVLDPTFLSELAANIKRQNAWDITIAGGTIYVVGEGFAFDDAPVRTTLNPSY
jgi:uncharacterized protein YaeQ